MSDGAKVLFCLGFMFWAFLNFMILGQRTNELELKIQKLEGQVWCLQHKDSN